MLYRNWNFKIKNKNLNNVNTEIIFTNSNLIIKTQKYKFCDILKSLISQILKNIVLIF